MGFELMTATNLKNRHSSIAALILKGQTLVNLDWLQTCMCRMHVNFFNKDLDLKIQSICLVINI